MADCYIVSTKHTRRDARYITFWRPDNCGYSWPLSWAGRYSSENVMASQDYYNNGHSTVAVPCSVIDPMGVAPEPGMVDGDTGPVVLNNKANWTAILAAALAPPLHQPEPQYKGARKARRRPTGHKES